MVNVPNAEMGFKELTFTGGRQVVGSIPIMVLEPRQIFWLHAPKFPLAAAPRSRAACHAARSHRSAGRPVAAGREGLVRRLSTDIHLGMNQRGVAAGQNRWSGLPIAVLIIVACINHTH